MSWDFEDPPPEPSNLGATDAEQTPPAEGLPLAADAAPAPAAAVPVAVTAVPAHGGWFLRIVAALWLGSGVFLLAVAAPAAFRASDTPTNAANVVGAMLTRWHYIGLLLPVVLIVIGFRRARVRFVAILFFAILLAAVAAGVDLRIRSMRAESSTPISELAPADPVRRHFGLLHGISSLLLLGQIALAAAAVANDAEK